MVPLLQYLLLLADSAYLLSMVDSAYLLLMVDSAYLLSMLCCVIPPFVATTFSPIKWIEVSDGAL